MYFCRVDVFSDFERKCHQRSQPAIILNSDKQHLLGFFFLRKSKVEVRLLPSVCQLLRLSRCCQKLLLSHRLHLPVCSSRVSRTMSLPQQLRKERWVPGGCTQRCSSHPGLIIIEVDGLCPPCPWSHVLCTWLQSPLVLWCWLVDEWTSSWG